MKDVSDSDKILIEALRDYKADFVSTGYSTMGFLLLIAGWLITSDKARDFIRIHTSVSIIGIILIVSAFCGYFIGASMVQDSSEQIMTTLRQSEISDTVYSHLQLTWRSLYLFASIQALPTILICWILGISLRK